MYYNGIFVKPLPWVLLTSHLLYLQNHVYKGNVEQKSVAMDIFKTLRPQTSYIILCSNLNWRTNHLDMKPHVNPV